MQMPNIDNLLLNANKAYDEQSFDKSSKLFENILSLQLKSNQLFQCHNRLAHSYLRLNELDKAQSAFNQIVESIPNVHHGFEGLALIAQRRQDWNTAIKYWLIVTNRYKKVPHAFESLANCYLKLNKAFEAKIVLKELIFLYPDYISGYIKIAKLAIAEENFDLIKYYYDLALKYCSSEKDVERVNQDFYQVFKSWANLGKSVEKSKVQISSEKWKKVLDLYPNNQDAMVNFCEPLLTLGRFKEVKEILDALGEEVFENYDLTKISFLNAHHSENWLKAKESFLVLLEKFHKKYETLLVWYFFQCLQNLNEEHLIEDYYLQHIQLKYSNVLEYYPNYDFHLERITIARFLKNKQYINDLKSSFKPHELSFQYKYPILHTKQFKLLKHSVDNDTLVIIFSGLGENNPYHVYNKSRLESLDDMIHYFNEDTGFTFNNFTKRNTQYNFLLVNDIYNSWYQLNFNKYIDRIKKFIQEINPKKIVCIGGSAGGFASLIFGQILNVDLIFSFSPQGAAITAFSGIYTKDLQIQFSLGLEDYSNIFDMQSKFNGFMAKTFVVCCKNQGADKFGISNLDYSDKNLNYIEVFGNDHSPIQYLGTKNVFRDMCEVIEHSENLDKVPFDNLFIKYKVN